MQTRRCLFMCLKTKRKWLKIQKVSTARYPDDCFRFTIDWKRPRFTRKSLRDFQRTPMAWKKTEYMRVFAMRTNFPRTSDSFHANYSVQRLPTFKVGAQVFLDNRTLLNKLRKARHKKYTKWFSDKKNQRLLKYKLIQIKNYFIIINNFLRFWSVIMIL